MKPAFTAGPWVRDRTAGLGCDVRAASGKKVALCYGIHHLSKRKGEGLEAFRKRYERYRAQCDADATLIAATPDLYEVARLLIEAEEMPADGGQYEALQKAVSAARSAVSKANEG